jgi:hypothetical protein
MTTKAAIATMVGGLALEWLGPNEYALGTVGSHALQRTHNIYDTGAATGFTSFLIQTGVGFATAWALSRCPDAIDKVRERFNSNKKHEAEQPLSIADEEVSRDIDRPLITESDIDLSLEMPEIEKRTLIRAAVHMGRTAVRKTAGIGAEAGRAVGRTTIRTSKAIGRPLLAGSAVNLIMEARNSERKTRVQNMAKVVGWSAIVGAGVDLLSTGGAQLLIEGAKHGLEPQAHFVVSDVLPNPLTYLTIFGGIYGITKGVQAAKRKLPEALNAIRTKISGPGRHVKGRKIEVLSQESKEPTNG